eukprot:Trichotokara_eunicae@DN5881_c0_g1_i13.p1
MHEGHSQWVRDVAWRPTPGGAANLIASCGEDGNVILWKGDESNGVWMKHQTISMAGPVWRVSWTVTGTVLAVASGDETVTLLKEVEDGKWEVVLGQAASEALELEPSS